LGADAPPLTFEGDEQAELNVLVSAAAEAGGGNAAQLDLGSGFDFETHLAAPFAFLRLRVSMTAASDFLRMFDTSRSPGIRWLPFSHHSRNRVPVGLAVGQQVLDLQHFGLGDRVQLVGRCRRGPGRRP
jgi:hypothetical protein